MGSEEDVGRLYPVAKAVITPVFRASWHLQVEGLENVPDTGGAILCPNHTSVLDSFFVPAVLPRRVTYVGKAEYMDDWKTKHLFPALGMIPIDRGGGDAAERALSAAQRILESGQLFGIYPEGTRSRDGRLYRGKTGPARLALRTGVPLIPIGISGAREVMPPEAKFPKLRRPVTIRFGEPIDVTRYRERADDHLLLRQIADEVMYEIRELSGQEYVNEYAGKKRPAAAPSLTPERTAIDAIAGRSAPAGEQAPVNGTAVADDAVADHDREPVAVGAGSPRGDLFDAEMTPPSSADLLRRPAQHTPV